MAVNVGQRNVPDTPANRQQLVKLAKAGKITKAKADECFKSWCANASKGNSYKLIQRMKQYYNNLWRKHDES